MTVKEQNIAVAQSITPRIACEHVDVISRHDGTRTMNDFDKEPAIAIQDVFSKTTNNDYGLAFFKKLNNPMNDIRQIAMGAKPDPTKFTIKHLEHVHGNTIVIANYGGETFNGDKLMVLKGIHENFETLDPHFLNETYPVFARFQPTSEGLKLARMAASLEAIENVIPDGFKIAYDHFDEQIVKLIEANYQFLARRQQDLVDMMEMRALLNNREWDIKVLAKTPMNSHVSDADLIFDPSVKDSLD